MNLPEPAPHPAGRLLIAVGLLLVVVGAGLLLAPRGPWLGRLPGDIHYRRGNFSFYFPLTTLILINLLIYLVMRLFRR